MRPSSVRAATDGKKDGHQKKVILVIINNIGLEDLTADNTPNLYRFANTRGAVGLMNTRTAGSINDVNNYLTVGTGVKAAGGIWGGLAFNSDEYWGKEKAGDVYKSRTGISAPPNGVVNLAVADISRQSQQYKLDIYPGLLGKSLKEGGLTTGVLGNADTEEGSDKEPSYHREASLIAMDQLGRIEFGNVTRQLVTSKPPGIGGFETDYGLLFSQSEQLLSKVDFLVVETGDTARIDEFFNFILDREIPKKRNAALKNADKFVGKLSRSLNLDKSLLIVASLAPSRQMERDGNNLLPIIMAGKGIRSGVLTSPTTRRHGIVDNTDIAPTIISFLGAEIPYSMSGRAMSGESQPNATTYLETQLQQILLKAQIRIPVLTTYVTIVAIILILSLLILLLGEKGLPYLKFFKPMLLWAISVPLAMLLSAAFNYSSYVSPVSATLAISFALVGLCSLYRKDFFVPVLILSLLTCVAIVLDTLGGAHLIQRSLLGYCPIIGARFYGIGNEYEGILIGSSIIGLTLLLDISNLRSRWSFTSVGFLFAFIAFVIGYQGLGANVSGAIEGVVGFFVTFIGIWQGKVRLKHVLVVTAAVLVAISALAAVDLLQKGGNSHLGRSILLIQKGGFDEVAKIIQRKLAMNIKGTRYTAWTRILVATLVVFPTLFLRPVGALARLTKEYPLLTAGHIGCAFGAIAAFIFNDTGAAAAATIIVFSVVATLYMVMEEQMKAYHLRSN